MGFLASLALRQRLLPLLFLGALGAGCGSKPSSPEPAEVQAWDLDLHDLPAALLSVSGRAANDVWTVGALLDQEALVLHSDGQTWERVHVGAPGDLWWVDAFDDGTLLMAGSAGTIIQGDGVNFTTLPTPDPTVTLYGIWGTDPEHLWAVGTDGTNGVVWRSSDQGGFEVADVDPALLDHAALFKVWGRSDDDVWMVGIQGQILHFDGTEVSRVTSDNQLPLTTVQGTDSALYAVGGIGGAVVLELEGDDWVDVTPTDAPSMNGVYARGDVVYTVGVHGEVLRKSGDGAFERVETGLDLARDYHAVWIDEEGGVWAVGGHVSVAPLVQGLLSYSGSTPPPADAPAL
ncbi:MAG TPA: hypothetical protein VMI54_06950 [Polyangiaceae bacterium]|nr:hypothetical protein [Polyangiaceae bacterium]